MVQKQRAHTCKRALKNPMNYFPQVKPKSDFNTQKNYSVASFEIP